MSQSINRRQFLSGDLAATKAPLRPPWALDEVRFIACCTGCGDCIDACSDRLIQWGRGKLPQMDFSTGGCDFCLACLEVCRPAALVKSEKTAVAPWPIKAVILVSCLSLKGVICRSCGEVCDERAIRFKLELGGVARPLLDQGQCTGCGACYSACPSQSIKLSLITPSREHAA